MSMNSNPVHSFHSVDEACKKADSVTCTVFRDGIDHKLQLKTTKRRNEAMGNMLVQFAGASLQSPPFAISHLHSLPSNGVYVSGILKGSPAERYHLMPTTRIMEVDGKETNDLETFISQVRGKKNGTSIRMKIVSLQGHEFMLTLKMDTVYWPTEKVYQNETGSWLRSRLN
mmetsp:Transcript_8481/g.12719  ORF Transcript_8481/g.12719 Transcript_8481/m.12719 type:complete len:171 (+) Transcript_8481:302-814(+)